MIPSSQKFTIQNRKGLRIVVLLEECQKPVGLAFVMHGLGGFKEQPMMVAMAEIFLKNGFSTVRFDTTNTFGESEGKYEDATTTNYFEDLEDVIAWAKTQPWYREPFVLAGHSLGSISVALYAEKHPGKVRALAPFSTVVSAEYSLEAMGKHHPEKLAQWRKTGWREEKSFSKPGLVKRLPWSHMLDRMRHNLLPHADKLTMPLLLVTGEYDTSTPPEHVRVLFDHAPSKQKTFHIVSGAPHTFRDEQHLRELRQVLDAWIQNI